MHWEVQLYDLTIGNVTLNFNANRLIIDSGASNNYVPPVAYKQIMDELVKDKNCSQAPKQPMKCECTGANDPSFKTIRFELGSTFLRHWFEMRPENYLQYSSRKSSCWISILEETDTPDVWILGDPFLMGYYSIFDYDNMKIGLVGPSFTSFKCFLSDMDFKS